MWSKHNPQFAEMQAMKAREVEHVRWGAVQLHNDDRDLQVTAQAMRTDARNALQKPLDLQQLSEMPGSASIEPNTFLTQRHKENLAVTKLKKDSGLFAQETAELFKRLPDSTISKVGDEQLSTEWGRPQAITQLVSKHSGEIVELDKHEASWV